MIKKKKRNDQGLNRIMEEYRIKDRKEFLCSIILHTESVYSKAGSIAVILCRCAINVDFIDSVIALHVFNNNNNGNGFRANAAECTSHEIQINCLIDHYID